MELNLLIFLKIFTILFSFKKNLQSVPPDYCLQRLNDSDCNEAPIQVFSYFKPGSRCEIELWKGCPTLNKFYTERNCIEVCMKRPREIKNSFLTGHGYNSEICTKPLNPNKCSRTFSFGFVFNRRTKECVKIIWTGCPQIGTIFQKKKDCVETCIKHGLKWKDKMYNLTVKQSEQINAILKAVLSDIDDEQESISPQQTESTKQSTSKTEFIPSNKMKLFFNITTEKKQLEHAVIFDDKINKNNIMDVKLNEKDKLKISQKATDERDELTTKIIPTTKLMTENIASNENEIENVGFEPNIHSYGTTKPPSIKPQITEDNLKATETMIQTIATIFMTTTEKPSTTSTVVTTTTVKVGTAKEVVLPDEY